MFINIDINSISYLSFLCFFDFFFLSFLRSGLEDLPGVASFSISGDGVLTSAYFF